MPSQNIQWFPGHMARTRRLITENLKNVDAVIELLDARIPYSSRNPEISRLCAGKPRIVLLNKASLADPAVTKAWAQKMTDENILRLLELQRCDRLACAPDHRQTDPVWEEIPAVMQRIREEKACLSLKDLAVKGQDLMSLGIPAGKLLGELLSLLLDEVVDGNLPNEREALLTAAETRRFSLEKQGKIGKAT